MPQVLNQLALTAVHFLFLAITTGRVRGLVLPSPSWPRWLTPQQKRRWFFLMPQVEPPPADTRRHGLPWVTRCGVGVWVPFLPSPSCPKELRPQHSSEPSPGSRQVCSPPLEMASMPARRRSRRREAGRGGVARAAQAPTGAVATVPDVAVPAPAGAARASGDNRLTTSAMRAASAFMATSEVGGAAGRTCETVVTQQ